MSPSINIQAHYSNTQASALAMETVSTPVEPKKIQPIDQHAFILIEQQDSSWAARATFEAEEHSSSSRNTG